MRSMRWIAALALLVAAGAHAGDTEFAKKAFDQMLQALADKSYDDFVALGDERFQQMPQRDFKGAAKKFAPLLNDAYKSTYVGSFKDGPLRVHYWKLEFASEPRDWVGK